MQRRWRLSRWRAEGRYRNMWYAVNFFCALLFFSSTFAPGHTAHLPFFSALCIQSSSFHCIVACICYTVISRRICERHDVMFTSWFVSHLRLTTFTDLQPAHSQPTKGESILGACKDEFLRPALTNGLSVIKAKGRCECAGHSGQAVEVRKRFRPHCPE